MKNLVLPLLLFLIVSAGVSIAQKSGVSSYSSDPKVVSEGRRLFEEHCAACHNFSQKSIGPSLQRATTESPHDWLSRFVRNAPEMILSGDSRSIGLFEEYKQMMPPFPSLSADQIDAILAFIHQNQNSGSSPDEPDAGYIDDPIPGNIPMNGGKLYLQYHSTAPATGAKAPLARINKMQSVKIKEEERLFVVDLEGILYEIRQKEWHIAMNIKKLRPQFVSSPGLGTGFGSFAFHPDFNENRLLYTTHAEKGSPLPGDLGFADSIKVGLQWVLTEWEVDDVLSLPFRCKRREVLRIDLLTTSHGVQEITFNPLARIEDEDYGLLYIGVGDGGSAEKNGFYHLCNSNTMASGAVLRIDPRGRSSANRRYGIPPGNPFAKSGDPAVVKEIFCRGLRNPNRITWTPDGRMLICDIGQSNIEEINLGTAGADYGWPEREGTFAVNPRGDINRVFPLPDDEEPGKYTYPVLQYDHDEGKAISGGFVYDSREIPELKGKYVFADITNGRFFVAENTHLKPGKKVHIKEPEIWVDNRPATFQEIVGIAKPDPRLGIGPGGALYVFTKADGKLYKVTGYRNNR